MDKNNEEELIHEILQTLKLNKKFIGWYRSKSKFNQQVETLYERTADAIQKAEKHIGSNDNSHTIKDKPKKRSKKTVLFLIISFFIFLIVIAVFEKDETSPTKNTKTTEDVKEKEIKKPEITQAMYDKRFELFGEYISDLGLITKYNYNENTAKVWMSDVWYELPNFQKERALQLIGNQWLTANRNAGFKSEYIYIEAYDAWNKTLGSWSAIRGAKIKK